MTTSARSFRALLLTTASLTLVACAENAEDAAAEAEQAAQQAASAAIVVEPLTAADLVGIDSTELVLEIPWSSNRMSRDPAPAAARASLREVAVSGHERFDRAIFHFTDETAFPGYQVELQPLGTAILCGEEEVAGSTAGTAQLVVTLTPARGNEDGEVFVPVRSAALDQTRLLEGGLACDQADAAIWVAGVASGTDVRVLELRGPNRLVVDVR